MLNFSDIETVNEVKSERELTEEIVALKREVAMLKRKLEEATQKNTELREALEEERRKNLKE